MKACKEEDSSGGEGSDRLDGRQQLGIKEFGEKKTRFELGRFKNLRIAILLVMR